MVKQKLVAIMGVVLSFVIAFGGWALTSLSINRQSDAMLYKGGATYPHMPKDVPLATQEVAVENPQTDETRSLGAAMDEEQMVDILRNWESDGRENYHEPTEEQMTMEEAIKVSGEFLSYYKDSGIFLDGEMKYDKTWTTAYLCQRIPDNRGREKDEKVTSVYSYWTVVFTGETMSVTIVLNAVSGQVWAARLTMNLDAVTSMNYDGAGNMLRRFMEGLKIDGSGKVKMKGTYPSKTFYQKFDGGNAYGVATITSRFDVGVDANSSDTDERYVVESLVENNERMLVEINMYLSTQVP